MTTRCPKPRSTTDYQNLRRNSRRVREYATTNTPNWRSIWKVMLVRQMESSGRVHSALAPEWSSTRRNGRKSVGQRCASGSGLVLEDTRVGRASVSQPNRSALCLCLIHACVTRLILRKLNKRTTCQRVLAKSVLRADMRKDLVKARRRLAVGLTNTRAQVSMVSLVPSGKRLIHPT